MKIDFVFGANRVRMKTFRVIDKQLVKASPHLADIRAMEISYEHDAGCHIATVRLYRKTGDSNE